ncbi:MAG: amidohydrolase [Azospirillaceae bacterium]
MTPEAPGNGGGTVVIGNACVLPLDDAHTVIEPGHVIVRGDRIHAVGEGAAPAEPVPAGAEQVDAAGGLVMPGFVNTHGHLAMSLFRGLGDDEPDRLRRYIFPLEKRFVGPEMVRLGTALAAIELIEAGVTTAADMYYFEAAVAATLGTAGLRALVGQTVVDFPAPDAASPDDSLARTETLIADWGGHDRIRPSVAPHAPYTTDRPVLERCRDLARRAGVMTQLHLAEMDFEDSWVRERHGTGPVAFIGDLGMLGPGLVAAHCLHLDDADIALLADSRTGVAHNAGANAKGGKGIARITDLMAAGAVVGLGTDGPMSGNTIDLFAQMDLVAKLQKLRALDRQVMTAREVVRLATRGGADVLGLGGQVGRLAPGMAADLIVIDRDRPRWTPRHDPYAALVYAARPDDVRDTMVAGRWLMRGRRVLTLDRRAILEEADSFGRRLRAAL